MKELALLLLLTRCAETKIACRGLNGEPVDWYIVYKPPTTSRSTTRFYYVDPKHTDWTLAPTTMDDGGIVVGATLQEFYKRDQRAFIFAYSDNSPSGKVDSYRGHSKGVVIFDDDTGFWLIHSVPNFPQLGSYSYPTTGVKFGQMFLCLTLPVRVLGDVGEHLRYVQATPFFSNLPSVFAERFPVLVNIVKKQSLSKSDTRFTRVSQLTTVGGLALKSFAKHKKFNKDLWFDLVAPELGTNLAVESWLNGGANDLESFCTRRTSVYDVKSIKLPNMSFNSSRDHSKWAVGDHIGGTNVVCVGDLNRQKSQLRRGGGAVCFRHRGFWKVFHNTVKSVQPCFSKDVHSYFSTALYSVTFNLILVRIFWIDVN